MYCRCSSSCYFDFRIFWVEYWTRNSDSEGGFHLVNSLLDFEAVVRFSVCWLVFLISLPRNSVGFEIVGWLCCSSVASLCCWCSLREGVGRGGCCWMENAFRNDKQKLKRPAIAQIRC